MKTIQSVPFLRLQKLNEGWDVLNLYDIVRLYEGQNTGGTNTTVGATTLAEAQLIGRGARYFPFALDREPSSKFTPVSQIVR